MPHIHTAWDISLEHLYLGYENKAILNNINTVIPGGKITFILGESGCGKSTLLRHIIGLSKPISGKILYGGQDLFSLPTNQFRSIRRRFGVLFQDGALLGALTLAENVGLPLSENTNLSSTIIRKTVIRTLSLVGLEKFADFFPNELSGGMKKRGGLARAIITEPPILFCDEPTSGLDPINSAQMDQLLVDMKKQYPEMTLLVVSHDLASVSRIAEHILFIKDGAIIFSGSYPELKNSKDTYLQRFIDRKPEKERIRVEISPVTPAVRVALNAWLKE